MDDKPGRIVIEIDCENQPPVLDGIVGEAVDARREALGHWLLQLQGLAADSHRIVADTLQNHVDANRRRHFAQGARAGQIPGDESVAKPVALAGVAVDWMVSENDVVSEFGVANDQRALGLTQGVLHVEARRQPGVEFP